MEKRGISKLDLKRRNRMQILRVIRESGPISRVDVASALEITRAAVTIITNEMIEEGVLVEIGEAPINTEKLQKGRRKILIDINVNSRFALGATVDEKEVSIGLTNLNSEILDTTEAVMFEAAKFARDNIRRTSRSVGKRTDSSARFEKGVDEYATVMAMKRALHLVEELGCGKVSSTHFDVNTGNSVEPREMRVEIDKISGVLGITVPDEDIVRIMNNLDMKPSIEEEDGKRWLNTFDLVDVNEDGSLTYVGRMNKFFINNEGVRFDAIHIDRSFPRTGTIWKGTRMWRRKSSACTDMINWSPLS